MWLLIAALVNYASTLPSEIVESFSIRNISTFTQDAEVLGEDIRLTARAPSWPITLTAAPLKVSTNQMLGYTIPIRLGPAEDSDPDSNLFPLIFDTASDPIWAFSDLPKDTPNGQKTYHYRLPRDCLPDPKPMSYADGTNVVLIPVSDSLAIGDVSIQDYEFFAADAVLESPNGWIGRAVSGYFGAGTTIGFLFGNARAPAPHTVLMNYNIGAPSTVVFGKIDGSLTSGSIKWVPILDPAGIHWTIAADDGKECLLDTGTTALQILENDAKAYYDKAKKDQKIESRRLTNEDIGEEGEGLSRYWEIPCNSGPQLPPVEFAFGKRDFSVKGDVIVGVERSPGWCYSLLVISPESNQVYLGIPFFHSYNVIFDVDNDQVGLANKP